jgi:GMP synthase PP-ATPase subunit
MELARPSRIDLFEEEALKLWGVEFLAQETLCPEGTEWVNPRGGPSVCPSA